jgi:hypothetical protein
MNESSNKLRNFEKRKHTECPEKRRARDVDVIELTLKLWRICADTMAGFRY